MATVTGIVESIKSVMSAVTGVGKVHSYRRYAVNEAAFKTLAATSGQMNFWQIWRASTSERWPNTYQYQRTHSIAIQGYLGSRDEHVSEHSFQMMIERIAARFRLATNRTLGNTVLSIAAPGGAGGFQIQSVEHGMPYGILAHSCRAQITVVEHPSEFAD